MAEPINGTILAKVMRGAPDRGGTEYAWELLKEAFGPAKDAAQTVAGFVSPGPNTLGAAGVAGIRSLLPGSGTYRQELDRYNQAAAPEDSVVDRVPMPGEDEWAFMRRQTESPTVQREVMHGSTMAAPIAVHASPNKWSGQPTRAKAGTGEGGAAYGEGLYATVPTNAKGIDERYRVRQGLDTTPAITIKGEDIRSVSMPADAHYYLGNEVRAFLEGKAKTLNPEDALFWARTKLRSQVDWTRKAMEDMRARGHVQAVENHAAQLAEKEAGLAALEALTPADIATHVPGEGSFHVWDVPDRLMDWDKPLSQQPEAARTLRAAGMMPEVKPLVELPREAWPFGSHPDDAAVLLGGKPVMRAVPSYDPSQMPGRDVYRMVGEHAADSALPVSFGVGTPGTDALRSAGIQGHTYAGEAGSARTSGIEGDVPNFVIYDDAAVKPLGTFGSADEWLKSDLYRQLKPRIDAEEALRRAGQASPEAYAMVRAMYNGQQR